MSSRWGFLESYGYASGWILPEFCDSVPAVMPLTSLASWTLRGQGAMEFLQGYVSSDLATLEPGRWQVTCFCSIKGRVLATAFVCGDASEVSFLMREEMIDPLIDSLKKYLAFARVCSIAREPLHAFGCIGSPLNDIAVESLRLPCETSMGLVLSPQDQSASDWRKLVDAGHLADERLWTSYEIETGFVHLTPNTREQFLPQMLGLEHLGAISYNKGCYLGQEIITRAAHRGKVKRRLVRLEFQSENLEGVHPGTKLCSGTGREVGVLIALAPGKKGPGSRQGLAVLGGDPQAGLKLLETEVAVVRQFRVGD